MAGRPAGGGAGVERLREYGARQRGGKLRRELCVEWGACRKFGGWPCRERAGRDDGAGSEAPELTEEDIQAAEAAARDYYAGTVFTVEGMEYLPQGSHPFAEGECNFTVTVRKDGAAQEDRLIQLDRTETGWTVVNEGY